MASLATHASSVPVAILPPEWSNDRMMSYLFSQINFDDNEDLRTKVSFWIDCIDRAVTYSKQLLFTEADVTLERKGDTPQCIHDVIEIGIKERKIIIVEQNSKRLNQYISTPSLVDNLLNSLQSALSALTLNGLAFRHTPSFFANTQLMLTSHIQDFESKLSQFVEAEYRQSHIIDFGLIQKFLGLSTTATECFVYECIQNETLVYIPPSDQQSKLGNVRLFKCTSGSNKQTSQTDYAVGLIEYQIRFIEQYVEESRSDCVIIKERIREVLQIQGYEFKQVARNLLMKMKRKQHLLDNSYSKLSSLHQVLDALYTSIENDSTAEALKHANLALKKSIDVDSAKEVMEEMTDLVADVGEVSQILSDSVSTEADNMIQDELQAMQHEIDNESLENITPPQPQSEKSHQTVQAANRPSQSIKEIKKEVVEI